MNFPLRAAYELGVFLAFCAGAYEIIVIKRWLMIAVQAATTGTSVAQIMAVQNASSGMWAFGEGLEQLFVLVLLYLLRPVCFNLACDILKRRGSPKSA